MDNKRVRLLIHGRVQGIFFRALAQQKAAELGLSGWVRNNPDGSVEVVAEGVGDNVHSLVEWCHKGPRHATVKHVSVVWESPSGEFEEFTIEYL